MSLLQAMQVTQPLTEPNDKFRPHTNVTRILANQEFDHAGRSSHRVGCFRAPEIQQRLTIHSYKTNQSSLESGKTRVPATAIGTSKGGAG
jgi:hypothetical protein